MHMPANLEDIPLTTLLTPHSLLYSWAYDTIYPPEISPQFEWDHYSAKDLIRFAHEIAAVLKQKGIIDLPNQFKLYL
jgi:hypothetical protein